MAAERKAPARRPSGAVYITPGRVYDLVLEGRESLVRIEGRVASIDRSVTERLDDLEADIAKVDKRVAPLEHRVWAWPSLAGLVGAVGLVLTIMQMSGAT